VHEQEAVLPEAYSPEWYVAQMTRRNDEGKPNLALLLWDKLRRGEGLPDRRPQPTLGSYGQAMRACHLMGDLPMAKRLLRELREQGVVDMYTAGLDWAVRLLARSRRYVEAIRLLEETALAPGVRLRVSSFNILMEELAGIRRWREVPKVLTLMSAYRLHPNADSFCLVITAHVALGNMKEATRVLAEMGERGLAPSDGFVETWSGLMRRGELGPATEDEGGEGLAGMAPS
jgi:pentatricopeptide repeat protein